MVQSGDYIFPAENPHAVSVCTTLKSNPLNGVDRGRAQQVGQRPKMPKVQWPKGEGNRVQRGDQEKQVRVIPIPSIHPPGRAQGEADHQVRAKEGPPVLCEKAEVLLSPDGRAARSRRARTLREVVRESRAKLNSI